jgi:hypothetical protein
MIGADKAKLDNSVKAVLCWGNNGIGTVADTRYLTPYYADAIAAATVFQFRCPCDGTIKSMYEFGLIWVHNHS